jgi:hypothetical protein
MCLPRAGTLKKMIMKSYFMIWLCLAFIGCRHLPSEMPSKPIYLECATFPPFPPTIPSHNGYKIINDPDIHHIGYAVFNPNNPDEVLYDRGLLDKYVFNKKTKTNKFVFREQNSGLSRFMKWSRQDWILLNREGLGMWKIKSNGDSLMPIFQLNSGQASMGDWNYDGSKCIFHNNRGQYYMCSAQGQLLDSFPLADRVTLSWQHSYGLLALPGAFRGGNLILYDINTARIVRELTVGTGIFYGICWISDDIFVTATSDGVYSVNVRNNNQITKLRNACDSRTYYFPSYSAQNNQLLFTRKDACLLDSVTQQIATQVVVMGVDGSAERLLNIPK